jgi:hypothetical protein
LCSVSTCIAEGPPGDWISRWLHNEFGVFSTLALARQALSGSDESRYAIHAYRILPLAFDGGKVESIAAPMATRPASRHPNCEPLPAGYRRLGFDAVELHSEMFFGCSPLSCNGGWEEFETNEHCLVGDMARAIELATMFSQGGWEPGPYRVVEVLSETE